MKMSLKKNWKIPFIKETLKQKRKEKKRLKKEHQALIDEDQELDEVQLGIDRLFAEYDKKIKSETNIDLDEQTQNSNDQFSSWA